MSCVYSDKFKFHVPPRTRPFEAVRWLPGHRRDDLFSELCLQARHFFHLCHELGLIGATHATLAVTPQNLLQLRNPHLAEVHLGEVQSLDCARSLPLHILGLRRCSVRVGRVAELDARLHHILKYGSCACGCHCVLGVNIAAIEGEGLDEMLALSLHEGADGAGPPGKVPLASLLVLLAIDGAHTGHTLQVHGELSQARGRLVADLRLGATLRMIKPNDPDSGAGHVLLVDQWILGDVRLQEGPVNEQDLMRGNLLRSPLELLGARVAVLLLIEDLEIRCHLLVRLEVGEDQVGRNLLASHHLEVAPAEAAVDCAVDGACTELRTFLRQTAEALEFGRLLHTVGVRRMIEVQDPSPRRGLGGIALDPLFRISTQLLVDILAPQDMDAGVVQVEVLLPALLDLLLVLRHVLVVRLVILVHPAGLRFLQAIEGVIDFHHHGLCFCRVAIELVGVVSQGLSAVGLLYLLWLR
mmetsp:Transcript_30793/g.69203  ORF Transcript_30793/g.69203 Transcript_30793/m.69203 type:complete len:469 (+) Transcript_30793:17-1423(+)